MPLVGGSWRKLALVMAAAALACSLAHSAEAASACRSSGPSYGVTVCLTDPADDASLTGPVSISATVTVSGTNPGVQKVVFYLSESYLLTDYSPPYTFTLPTQRFVDGRKTLEVEAAMRDGFITHRASVEVTFVNGITEPAVNTNTFTPSTGSSQAPGRPFILVAAGDGASGRPDAQSVTDLISSLSPNMFLYLGDVYEKGTSTEFYNWYGTADRYFGRFRSITNPTIGNHENLTPDSVGYLDYWDNVPHYFSFDVAGWHIVSIDSTGVFAQTAPASPQYQWLDQDLSSSSAACSMVFFHHPRWSVGQTGSSIDSSRMANLWSLFSQRGVDVVLNGHDHNYQRWHPLNADGDIDPAAPTEFVVGSGGHGIQPFMRTDSRLAAGFDSVADFGALQLELNRDGAAFQFINTQGITLDSGSVGCSGASADTTSPAAPANLSAISPAANQVDLSWTSSTDNLGVTAYEIHRNGSLLTTAGPTAKYTDTTVTGGATYHYYVRARDASGNVSGPSNTATATTPGTVPYLFSDGFETGNFSKWASNAGLFAQQQEVFTGGWAARGTSTGAATWAYAQLGSTYGELFYRIRFKVLSQGVASNNSVNLLKLRTGAGASILGMFRNPQGRLAYRNDVAGVSTTSSTTVATGTWHELQIRARIHGGSGQSETWFNGVRIATLSKTENLGTNAIGRIQLGENSSSRTYDVAFDDVVADTSIISDGGTPSDTVPPSDPTDLNAVPVSSSRVDLTWTGSTDNVGVTAYDIFRNGSALVSVGTVTSYSDSTVSPSTMYQYKVGARDAAGNSSGLTNTSTVTTPSAPTVLTFAPTDDAVVRADQPGANFGAQGAIGVDSSPVKHYLLKFDVSGIGTSGVASAKLRLSCIDSSDSGGIFYRVPDPGTWSEGSVTWNSAPPADTRQLAALGSVSATKMYDVDLTSLVRGDGVISVKVVSNSATRNGADFSSKEGTAAPQLVVTLL